MKDPNLAIDSTMTIEYQKLFTAASKFREVQPPFAALKVCIASMSLQTLCSRRLNAPRYAAACPGDTWLQCSCCVSFAFPEFTPMVRSCSASARRGSLMCTACGVSCGVSS